MVLGMVSETRASQALLEVRAVECRPSAMHQWAASGGRAGQRRSRKGGIEPALLPWRSEAEAWSACARGFWGHERWASGGGVSQPIAGCREGKSGTAKASPSRPPALLRREDRRFTGWSNNRIAGGSQRRLGECDGSQKGARSRGAATLAIAKVASPLGRPPGHPPNLYSAVARRSSDLLTPDAARALGPQHVLGGLRALSRPA